MYLIVITTLTIGPLSTEGEQQINSRLTKEKHSKFGLVSIL